MDAGFSIYPGRPTTRSSGPQVSISKEGRFSLNRAATVIFDTDVVEKVLLRWNASTRRIAFQKLSKPDKRAFTVHYPKDSRGAGFNAKDFLTEYVGYNLSPSTRAYDAEWIAEEGVLVFQVEAAHLKKKSTTLPINAAKHAQA